MKKETARVYVDDPINITLKIDVELLKEFGDAISMFFVANFLKTLPSVREVEEATEKSEQEL